MAEKTILMMMMPSSIECSVHVYTFHICYVLGALQCTRSVATLHKQSVIIITITVTHNILISFLGSLGTFRFALTTFSADKWIHTKKCAYAAAPKNQRRKCLQFDVDINRNKAIHILSAMLESMLQKQHSPSPSPLFILFFYIYTI